MRPAGKLQPAIPQTAPATVERQPGAKETPAAQIWEQLTPTQQQVVIQALVQVGRHLMGEEGNDEPA